MKIIIVDDNAAIRMTLKMLLREIADEILLTPDPRLLPAMLRDGDVDAVLLDMNFDTARLDGRDGIFWLERIREIPTPPAVVMITAFGEVALAVEAMKLGAEDFITKPWNNTELIEKLQKAVTHRRAAIAEQRTLDKAREIEQLSVRRDEMTLDEVKAEHVRMVVERCGGNISAAATQLGINRQTLYNILKKV